MALPRWDDLEHLGLSQKAGIYLQDTIMGYADSDFHPKDIDWDKVQEFWQALRYAQVERPDAYTTVITIITG